MQRRSGSGTERRRPVLAAVGWSIAVVLVAGLIALAVTPSTAAEVDLVQGFAETDPSGGPAPDVEDEPGPAAPVGPDPAAGAAPATAPTVPPATAAPTAPARRASTSTSAARQRARATAPAGTAAPAPPARLQPDAGSYALRVVGTSAVDGRAGSVPASARLVVQQRSATDQVHRTDGLPGGLVIVQRATPSGIDLVSFSLTASNRTLTFAPATPLPFVRTDAPVGTSWSWTATSTDRSVTVRQTATVTALGTVDVGGASVPSVTVTRVLTASGTVQGTLRLTSTVSLADRLPLIQRQVLDVKATVLGLFSTRIVSDVTATLISTRPA